jgi:hypothetical protein
MQLNIKKFNPFRWAVTLVLATALFIGCNSDEKKEEEKAAEPAAVEAPAEQKAATDTMPVIDTTAKSRPDPIKTGESVEQ